MVMILPFLHEEKTSFKAILKLSILWCRKYTRLGEQTLGKLIIVESKMQHWTMLSTILFHIATPDFCLILGTVLPPEDCGILFQTFDNLSLGHLKTHIFFF